jgi:hypothetical protein
MERKIDVEKVNEQMVRITFTIGISGRFIDMSLAEAEVVRNALTKLLGDCDEN